MAEVNFAPLVHPWPSYSNILPIHFIIRMRTTCEMGSPPSSSVGINDTICNSEADYRLGFKTQDNTKHAQITPVPGSLHVPILHAKILYARGGAGAAAALGRPQL